MNANLVKLQQQLEAAESRFNWTTESEHGRFAVDSTIHTVTATEFRVRAEINRQRMNIQRVNTARSEGVMPVER